MKIILKGGVWKNTEDEILKAAVMKYGKNQWARISSLLNRKSPKQCKARWYEWLDPSIKKTEWTKEEDEKLLHLAKLMPTQWRTIAPIIGRTSTQCLERYQQLLDEAEMMESGAVVEGEDGIIAPSAEEIRRLRPGEIDPDPETKPAKPDPIDMDEDEMEMLSEARARLANTQGKKAKRKAREKQLEVARRLAGMQKRRELKAAGIEWRYRQRKKGDFDFNLEIPFAIPTPAGFYDTAEERERQTEKNFINTPLSELQPKTRAQKEEDARKEDEKKKKAAQEKGVFKVPDLGKLEEEHRISKRRKLNLPAPQIQDGELEQLVKIGQSSEYAVASIDSDVHSSALLSDYRQAISSKFAENASSVTARTPASHDHIHAEAANILRQQNLQTPLLGGENVELVEGGTGYSGSTPQRIVAKTPNPVAASLTPSIHGSVEKMARLRTSGMTPRATPLRDDLHINDFEKSWEDDESEAVSVQNARQQLELGFLNLPKPKNDYEIVLPDAEDDDKPDVTPQPMDEDMADVEERMIQEHADRERRRLARRSQVVQRELPKPSTIDFVVKYRELFGTTDEISKMIQDEMLMLISRDCVEHPSTGITPIRSSHSAEIEELEDIYLEKAKEELQKESVEEHDIDPNIHPSLAATFIQCEDGRFRYNENSTEAEYARALFESAIQFNDTFSQKTSKLRKKLEITLGGYIHRAKSLDERLKKAYEDYCNTSIEIQSFERLFVIESRIIVPERLAKMDKELKVIENLEREEQKKYKELTDKKSKLKM